MRYSFFLFLFIVSTTYSQTTNIQKNLTTVGSLKKFNTTASVSYYTEVKKEKPVIGIVYYKNQDSIKKISGNNLPGLLIKELKSNFPTAKAGLMENDLLLSINSKFISDGNNLINELKSYTVGDEIKLNVLRDKKTIEYNVKLVNSKNEYEKYYDDTVYVFTYDGDKTLSLKKTQNYRDRKSVV